MHSRAVERLSRGRGDVYRAACSQSRGAARPPRGSAAASLPRGAPGGGRIRGLTRWFARGRAIGRDAVRAGESLLTCEDKARETLAFIQQREYKSVIFLAQERGESVFGPVVRGRSILHRAISSRRSLFDRDRTRLFNSLPGGRTFGLGWKAANLDRQADLSVCQRDTGSIWGRSVSEESEPRYQMTGALQPCVAFYRLSRTT